MSSKRFVYSFSLWMAIILVCISAGCGSRNRESEQITNSAAQVPRQPVPSPTPSVPQVTISNPTPNQRFQQGQPISVVSSSVDVMGIVRVDLLANGQIVSSVINENPQGNQPFLVNQSWQPDKIGAQVIQVQAYNRANIPGISPQIFIEVLAPPQPIAIWTATATPIAAVQEVPTAIPQEAPTVSPEPTATPVPPEPTATPIPSEPTATPIPLEPYLIVTNNLQTLDVHSGPSPDYSLLGHLSPDDKALILGQNDIGAGRWWQISFPTAPNEVGWVLDNPEWVTPYHIDNVAQVLAAPTPLPVITPAIAGNQILFQEDFNSNAKGWRLAEENNDYSNSKQGLVNGQYQLKTLMAKQEVWETVTLPQFFVSNFLLNFKATISQTEGDFSSGAPAVAVSIWRNNTWYMVYFSNSGYKITSGGEQMLYKDHTIHLDWTPHPAINLETGITNDFSVLETGTTITLYANGTELVTMPNLTSGGPGAIRLHSYLRQANQSLTLDIDDIFIYGDPVNVYTGTNFRADRTLLKPGECTILRWQTSNVKEVYYEGAGVVGVGEQQECPTENKTYRLEVVKKDESRETQTVTIIVEGTACTDTGEFVSDVTYPDGSIVAVGETFTKTWHIKNTGSCIWDSEYHWRFSSEADNQSNFGHESFSFVGSVAPGLEYEVVQTLTAPGTPGQYTGQWLLVGPNRDDHTAWIGVALNVGGLADPTGCIDLVEFLADVTYPDGSAVAPGETFTKQWRIKNAGTCTWNNEYFWWFDAKAENGDNFGRQTFPFIGTAAPGADYEVIQELTAPTDPGTYTGQWSLLKRDRDGSAGWVGVQLEVR